MKDMALDYYRRGYGCSQCILKAAETTYNVRLDENAFRMAGALNTGMGVGGMCAVLIACVMVLGLMFGEETAKRHRIAFLSEFHKKYGGVDCGRIVSRRKDGTNCGGVVYDAAELLEEIIEKARW